MDSVFAAKAIGCMAAITIALRALPFIGAAHVHKFPRLLRLGRFLPPAIMTLLLLHTVRASVAGHEGDLWPELLATATAILLQWRTRQPLLSILAATGLYVAIRHTIT